MRMRRGQSPRQRKQQVQRSCGSVSGVFKVQQGDQCGWSGRNKKEGKLGQKGWGKGGGTR